MCQRETTLSTDKRAQKRAVNGLTCRRNPHHLFSQRCPRALSSRLRSAISGPLKSITASSCPEILKMEGFDVAVVVLGLEQCFTRIAQGTQLTIQRAAESVHQQRAQIRRGAFWGRSG